MDPSVTVLIVNTNVRHDHTSNEYAARRRSCETAVAALGLPSLREATMGGLHQCSSHMDPMSVRCARHVIGEIARTLSAAQCIRNRDWAQFGQLMNESHTSLKEDYAASCLELDVVVEIAQRIGRAGGVYGCRMTGGGFGGCAVALIGTAAQYGIVQEIGAEYRKRTTIEATIFVSRPGEGASIEVC
jgi:galactokinase